mmetsp:Transcript_10693/g.25239  ORF Transcript_10693/g.25239 Transcript_10693/m.25239 type:complete len:94 (-) Transcript_10693:656-937(-)
MPNSGSSYFHILYIQPRQGARVWSCLVCACFIPLEAMPTTLLAVAAMGIFAADHAVATVDLLDNASASGTLSTVRLLPLLIMLQLNMARSRLF